ncbi:MAG TPA: helix-turn-helix transcriptional regulator [Burkholderiaceae bacterium]|nr:helix-turn-helix transcriptional regulator [Burkholderiaceae bacterium]
MSKVQILEKDGKPAFAVVPIELWQRLREAVEDIEDLADLERFDREDDGFRIPHAVLQAELAGMHLVRAWREHRGLSQEQLAAAAGISKPYLSQIEGGKRAGPVATMRRLARALDVPVDVLVE